MLCYVIMIWELYLLVAESDCDKFQLRRKSKYSI